MNLQLKVHYDVGDRVRLFLATIARRAKVSSGDLAIVSDIN
jgi:hypothetical protein